MRFMILVKASNESEAGVMPSQELLHTMGEYHEQLAKAGVLLDANGLQPTSKGWRIRYSGGARTVIDGPFTETKELLAGPLEQIGITRESDREKIFLEVVDNSLVKEAKASR